MRRRREHIVLIVLFGCSVRSSLWPTSGPLANAQQVSAMIDCDFFFASFIALALSLSFSRPLILKRGSEVKIKLALQNPLPLSLAREKN